MNYKKVVVFSFAMVTIGGLLFGAYEMKNLSSKENNIRLAQSLIEAQFREEEGSELFDYPLKNGDVKIHPSSLRIMRRLAEGLECTVKCPVNHEFPHEFLSKNNNEVVDDLKIGLYSIRDNIKNLKRGKLSEVQVNNLLYQAIIEYSKGISLSRFPADKNGNYFLVKAYKKLLNIYQNSKHDQEIMAPTLYMLADTSFLLNQESKDHEAIVFYVEVIRRYGGQPISQMAWLKLNSLVHFAYSGSSGDNTPASWNSFLSDLLNMVTTQDSETMRITKISDVKDLRLTTSSYRVSEFLR